MPPTSSPRPQFTFSATGHSHSTPKSQPIHTIQPHNHPRCEHPLAPKPLFMPAITPPPPNPPSVRATTHTQHRNHVSNILADDTTHLQCDQSLTLNAGIPSPSAGPGPKLLSVRAPTHTLRPRWPSALECATRHSHITSSGSRHRYRNPAIPTISQPPSLAASRFQTKVPATTHTLSESVLSNQQCASRGAHITGNRSPTPALCASGHSHIAGTPPNQPASVRAAAHTLPPPRSHLRNVRALTHTLQTHRLAVGSQDAARC